VAGPDKPGAVAAAARKLADAGVNIHAVQAVSAGSRYGCLIEVAAQDVRKAAKALGL
jgi:predicted amino acid-binding ACT domain protein